MSLHLSSNDDFFVVRQLLLDASFREQQIAERLQAGLLNVQDSLGLLIDLFARAQPVKRDAAIALLGAETLVSFQALGLLEATGGSFKATCLLYPFEDLWIASDFPGISREDFVFPALSTQSHQFHAILPDTPCDTLLDIGAGAAAASLAAAKDYAASVCASDISKRCVLFAEFNRRLNDIANATIIESDVYEALNQTQTFDRIIAHPPYIPTLGDGESYRHGGPHGEDILRRVLAGFSKHLRLGGRAYLSTLACDHVDAPLEERLFAMLGSDDFRLLVAEWESLPAVEFVMRLVEVGELDFEQGAQQVRSFREAGVTQLVRCAVVVVRDGDGPQVMRRVMGKATGAAELDAVFEPSPEITNVLDQRFTLSSWTTLESTAAVSEGRWRSFTRVLDCQYPFHFRTDCPEWAVDALSRLDGKVTLREAISDSDVDLEESEIFFECLISAGALTLS